MNSSSSNELYIKRKKKEYNRFEMIGRFPRHWVIVYNHAKYGFLGRDDIWSTS